MAELAQTTIHGNLHIKGKIICDDDYIYSNESEIGNIPTGSTDDIEIGNIPTGSTDDITDSEENPNDSDSTYGTVNTNVKAEINQEGSGYDILAKGGAINLESKSVAVKTGSIKIEIDKDDSSQEYSIEVPEGTKVKNLIAEKAEDLSKTVDYTFYDGLYFYKLKDVLNPSTSRFGAAEYAMIKEEKDISEEDDVVEAYAPFLKDNENPGNSEEERKTLDGMYYSNTSGNNTNAYILSNFKPKYLPLKEINREESYYTLLPPPHDYYLQENKLPDSDDVYISRENNSFWGLNIPKKDSIDSTCLILNNSFLKNVSNEDSNRFTIGFFNKVENANDIRTGLANDNLYLTLNKTTDSISFRSGTFFVNATNVRFFTPLTNFKLKRTINDDKYVDLGKLLDEKVSTSFTINGHSLTGTSLELRVKDLLDKYNGPTSISSSVFGVTYTSGKTKKSFSITKEQYKKMWNHFIVKDFTVDHYLTKIILKDKITAKNYKTLAEAKKALGIS